MSTTVLTRAGLFDLIDTHDMVKPLYEDEWVTLYHGDFRELIRKISVPEIHVALMDPPYSDHVQNHSVAVVDNDAKTTSKREFHFEPMDPKLMRATAKVLQRVLRWSVLFTDDQINLDWRRSMALVGAEHIRQGLWVKPRGTPQTTGDRPGQWHEILEIFHPKGRKRWNGGGRPALYRDPVVRDKTNRSTKPLSLMQKLVMDFTNPGELVVDLFAGLGTTLLACKQLGRRCIGFEKDEANALAARDRLRQLLLGLEDPDLALPRWALRDPMLFEAQRLGFSPSDIPAVLPTKRQMRLFDNNLN